MRKKTIERNQKTIDALNIRFSELEDLYEKTQEKDSDKVYNEIKDELIQMDKRLENTLKRLSKNKENTEVINKNITLLRDEIQARIYSITHPPPVRHSDVPPPDMRGSSTSILQEQAEE